MGESRSAGCWRWENRCRSEGERDVSSGRRGRRRRRVWDSQEQRQRRRIILGDDDHSTEGRRRQASLAVRAHACRGRGPLLNLLGFWKRTALTLAFAPSLVQHCHEYCLIIYWALWELPGLAHGLWRGLGLFCSAAPADGTHVVLWLLLESWKETNEQPALFPKDQP